MEQQGLDSDKPIVVFLENHPHTAKEFFELLAEQLAERGLSSGTAFVNYRMATGAVRGVPDVATEAVTCAQGRNRAAFLVDLSPTDHGEVDYGLGIICEVAALLGYRGDVRGFLKDPRYLVVVPTIFLGTESPGWPTVRLPSRASVYAIEICSPESMSEFLASRTQRPLLALIRRGINDAWRQRLVAEWIAA